MHVIAAKAVAFGEALQPEFKVYARHIVDNARVLAAKLSSADAISSQGVPTHTLCW